MSKVQISFYDETISINVPFSLGPFKDLISRNYYLDPQDVEELIIYFEGEKGKTFIRTQEDYNDFLEQSKKARSPGQNIKIFLEVSEKSRLYLNELENSKVVNESLSISHTNDSVFSEQEKLLEEIRVKESQLKELLEKEKLEAERLEKERILREQKAEEERAEVLKKEEEKRILEELEKEKEEIERIQQEMLEFEFAEIKRAEEERLAIETEERERSELHRKIRETCTEIINNNIENIKSELIDNAFKKAVASLDKTEPKLEETKAKTVHNGFSCNECKVFPIVGTRYKCTVCFDYDMCEKCEEHKGDPHGHSLIKHRVEQQRRPGHCPFKEGRREKHHGGIFDNLAHNMKNFIGELANCIDQKSADKANKLTEVRQKYFLGTLTDEEINEALKMNGDNVDLAVEYLCNKFLNKK